MPDNNEESLYTSISEFVKQFTYKYEEGLDLDIQENLGWQQFDEQKIDDFDLTFDENENHFKIIIYLAETNFNSAHRVF